MMIPINMSDVIEDVPYHVIRLNFSVEAVDEEFDVVGSSDVGFHNVRM